MLLYMVTGVMLMYRDMEIIPKYSVKYSTNYTQCPKLKRFCLILQDVMYFSLLMFIDLLGGE